MFASKHRKYKLFPLVNRWVVPGLSRLSKSLCVQSLCAFLLPYSKNQYHHCIKISLPCICALNPAKQEELAAGSCHRSARWDCSCSALTCLYSFGGKSLREHYQIRLRFLILPLIQQRRSGVEKPIRSFERQVWPFLRQFSLSKVICLSRRKSAFAKRGACKRGLRKLGHRTYQVHSNYIPETWSNHDCH